MSLLLGFGLSDLIAEMDARKATVFCLMPMAALFAWRLWRFTIQPHLDQNAPKELPYWIPFIGHAFPLVGNLEGLIKQGMKYCGDTYEPFSVLVFGQRLYFAFSEQDMACILSGTIPEITHIDHVRDLLKLFGSSPQGLRDMYMPPSCSSGGVNGVVPNPKQKPLALLAENLMNKQLLSIAEFRSLMNSMGKVIDKRTQWEGIPSFAIDPPSYAASSYMPEGDNECKRVSVLRWSQYTILEAMTTAWFGVKIWDLSPTIITDMICLDHEIWKLFYHLPKPWSGAGQDAASSLRRCLLKYVRLDPSEKEDRCWAARVAEEEMRLRGITEEDMASHLLMVFWGINANIFKVSFWLLTYITSDARILKDFRAEVNTVLSNLDSKDPANLCKQLDDRPFSTALFHETIRLVTNSSSERTVLHDCHINGRVYRAGARILLPYRYAAMSPVVSDIEPGIFRPERFLKLDEQTGDVINNNLQRSRSFIPFASGAHKCPGRVVTRKASLMFAALIVHRFSIKLMDDVPPMDMTKPPLGPVEPVHGRDFRLVLRPGHEEHVKDQGTSFSEYDSTKSANTSG